MESEQPGEHSAEKKRCIDHVSIIRQVADKDLDQKTSHGVVDYIDREVRQSIKQSKRAWESIFWESS